MNYKMIIYSIGRIVMAAGATMLVPLILSFVYGEGTAFSYILPIALSAAIGAAVYIKPPKNKSMYAREGFVIVALSWIIISLIGCLPFYLSGAIPRLVDCLFEMVSGITTTGSSILSNIEILPKSILFWRSFTHWLGGMGVLVFSMTIFSGKDTRTSYLMKAEMPGPVVGKLVSKWRFSIRILYMIYIALTAMEAILLMIGGLPIFDSVVHAFGTAGTGGFSIWNNSIAHYNSAYVEYVISVFMLLFGVNFSVFYLILARRFALIKENNELKWYLAIVAAALIIITFNTMPIYKSVSEAFRYTFFQVTSIVSTTGYGTADFTHWPMLSQVILLMLMVMGGCAGSTSGGIKVIRVVILGKITMNSIKNSASPRSVFSVKSEGKQLETAVLKGIMTYLVVFVMFFAVSLLLVSLDNKDFATTSTAVLTAISNVGPGLGEVSPSGNFSGFSDFSKIILSIDMLAGRLELYPMLILFSPYTWKKS